MCTACDWAPHFAALNLTSNRRTLLRAATVVMAATAAGTLAACAADQQPVPDPAPATGQEPFADFVFHNGPIYTVAGTDPWVQGLAVAGLSLIHI